MASSGLTGDVYTLPHGAIHLHIEDAKTPRGFAIVSPVESGAASNMSRPAAWSQMAPSVAFLASAAGSAKGASTTGGFFSYVIHVLSGIS